MYTHHNLYKYIYIIYIPCYVLLMHTNHNLYKYICIPCYVLVMYTRKKGGRKGFEKVSTFLRGKTTDVLLLGILKKIRSGGY